MSSEELAPALQELAERYEIVREVGRGGMASVFLARELATGRMVAIKTIDARHADDAEARARFEREARTVASLDHPNIVRTLAVEEVAGGVAAIIMEYVPGGTLRELLVAGGPLSFERAERILREVAGALGYAHGRGLVHRDVKPENVFLDEHGGRALLSDFGIARLVEEVNRLTLTGTSIGTPTYMSPEQIDGKRLDGRSDIYSLGLVGWEMLAGARPWEGESLYKVIYKQKHEELPRLTTLRPDIPEHLLFAIEGALHKDRDTRWANVDEFLHELTHDEQTRAVAAAPPALSAASEWSAPRDEQRGAEPMEPTPAAASAIASDDSAEARDGAAPILEHVPEDPWSEAYVPGTPEEEARLDAEALGLDRWSRAPWRSWGRKRATEPSPSRPVIEDDALIDDAHREEVRYVDDELAPEPRRRSTLLVPLALAAVALFAIVGGVRSRPATFAASPDSLTESVSAGELDSSLAPATTPAVPTTTSSSPDSSSLSSAARAAGGAAASEPRATPLASRPRTTSRATPHATPRTTPPARSAPSAATRRPRTHGDSLALCGTPGIVEQQACLSAALADRDVGLNNVYQTLIREMRRQEHVAVGSSDPSSVQRLRAEQRQWLVTRDETCRQESSAASSALWATPRVRCLGREGVVRAGVLADRLTRLRAP